MTTMAESQAAWMGEYADLLSQHLFGRAAPPDAVKALHQIAAKGKVTCEEVQHIAACFPALLESPARTMHAAGHGLLTVEDFPSHFSLGWTDSDALASFPRRVD